MYPQQPDYPPDYMPGNRWMPRVHSGFRYFLIALVVLTVGGYFTGNPYLVPNIFMSVFSQFQPHSATAPIAQTTDGTTVISPESTTVVESTHSTSSPPLPQHSMQTSATTAHTGAMTTTAEPVAVSTSLDPPIDSTNATTTHSPMTITTTVVPVPHNGSSQSSTSVNDQMVPMTSHHHTHVDTTAAPTPHARRVMASLASDTPSVPDGWYTWSVKKRARYVRALMTRIDAP